MQRTEITDLFVLVAAAVLAGSACGGTQTPSAPPAVEPPPPPPGRLSPAKCVAAKKGDGAAPSPKPKEGGAERSPVPNEGGGAAPPTPPKEAHDAKTPRASREELRDLLSSESLYRIARNCGRHRRQVEDDGKNVVEAVKASGAVSSIQAVCDEPTTGNIASLARLSEAQRLAAVAGLWPEDSITVPSSPTFSPSNGYGVALHVEPIIGFTDLIGGGLLLFVNEVVESEIQSLALAKVRKALGSCTTWFPTTCGMLGKNDTLSMSFGASLKHALIADLFTTGGRLVEHIESKQQKQALQLFDVLLRTSEPAAVVQGIRADWESGTDTLDLLEDGLAFVTVARDANPLADALAVEILAEMHRRTSAECKGRLRGMVARLRAVEAAARRIADSALSDAGRLHAVLPFVEAMVAALNDAGINFEGLEMVDRRILRVFSAAASEDVPRFLTALYEFLPKSARRKLPTEAITVLALGAELATAKTEADVVRTLKAFTGASNDRTARSQLNLALMAGGTAGFSWTYSEAKEGDLGPELGLLALLGFEASWDLGPKWIGVFVSVIDGLSAASYRGSVESNGSKEDLGPNVKSILAPGAYLEVALTRALVITAGVGVLPFGAKLGGDQPDDALVLRGHLALGISLPVLELSNW